MSHPTQRGLLGFLPMAVVLRRAAATVGEAGAFVDRLGQRTIAVLDRVGSDLAARQQAISALLDEAVDFSLIAHLCLERYWRTASEGQRADYVALFRANVLTVLSRRMGFYTGGEKFLVTASRPAGQPATTRWWHQRSSTPPMTRL
jgi:phospholipid transport system substrate-binding protein